jgi:hypothetical protein
VRSEGSRPPDEPAQLQERVETAQREAERAIDRAGRRHQAAVNPRRLTWLAEVAISVWETPQLPVTLLILVDNR